MNRHLIGTVTLLSIFLGLAERASAHRLDEYLQATRVSVERRRVVLEIDLTPGVSVAPIVFSFIDKNDDGGISKAEAEVYGQQVLNSISLSLDGAALFPTLVSKQFPEYREMSAGVGMIRLVGAVDFAASSAGAHELVLRNAHQPKISVYLANALVPQDRQIQITGQWRDREQRELTLDYTVSPYSRPSAWWLVGGLTLAGLMCLALRQLASNAT
jgi:hypothetical protein